MKKLKILYDCEFNYQGEVSKFTTQAFSEAGAFNNCMFKMAGRYHRSIWTMRNYFTGMSGNWKIVENLDGRWA